MSDQAKYPILRRVRPSPTVAVSILALVITFSGVAGALPGKNTVNSGDVKNDSLKGKDIKESTLDLPKGTVADALKFTVYQQVVPTLGSTLADKAGGATANCPAGKQAVAGGGLSDAGNTSVGTKMTDSRPSQGPAGTAPGAPVQDGQTFTGWRGFWNNDGEVDATPVVYVVCVG
jgi:hypothetical protein